MLLSAASIWLKQIDMHILTTGPEPGSYSDTLRNAGFQIYHISFRKNLRFFLRVADLLRTEQYDGIHLHTEKAHFFYALTVRIAVGYSPFIIRTVHHIFKFNSWLRFRKLMERQCMRLVLKVLFISNSPSGQRNEFERYRMKNLLFPNWFDSDHYNVPTDEQRQAARHQLGFPEDRCVFISLGGNWPYKNYDRIIEALTMIPKNISVLYLMVGVQGEGSQLLPLLNAWGFRIGCGVKALLMTL